ncbi:unnamed protein product, partial [Ectocarpus sp. 12 AP-2014]
CAGHSLLPFDHNQSRDTARASGCAPFPTPLVPASPEHERRVRQCNERV